ncbi:hypothetical protein F5Y10DRAFT_287279 [Nemania abortiva]|nr:hypothetical protein F5Y10DRAFT_287279 [Nemania abortiva]
MSFNASTNAQRAEYGHWRALTRLDGFDFPQEPIIGGTELKNFSKVVMGKTPWTGLTQGQLVIRVTAIFEAACDVYENENGWLSHGPFYASVAKKVSKSKFKDYGVFGQVLDTYVAGLKIAAARSENHIYVDRRSAPAVLSVASWIELTEGNTISITTKKPTNDYNNNIPPPQTPRKRRAEDVDDDRIKQEAKARKAQLKKLITERDQTCRELQEVKSQNHELAQKFEAMKHKYGTQASRLANAEMELKKKDTELNHAKAKHEKMRKAIKAVQRDRNDMVANLKRRYDDHASEYFALAQTEWRNATRELAVAKQERDQSQSTLADCAKVIKSLNSKLNGEDGGA